MMDAKLKGVANMSSLFYPTADNQSASKCRPDPDHIKMFVGQIPQSFNESDLMQMFEKFGNVYELILIKDNFTRKSKGCCFVTYFTRKAALDAQNALHNITILPGMSNPVQMKPADPDHQSSRKVFVGMLQRDFNEDDVRNLFSPYGPIEECLVLRDLCGNSKQCAFITYLSRTCALNAVESMHHSFTFKGCSSPMVVKIADNQKDKERRRMNVLPCEPSLISGLVQQPFTAPGIVSPTVLPNSFSHQLPQVGIFNSNVEDNLIGFPNFTNSQVNTIPLLPNHQTNMIQQLVNLSLLKNIDSTSVNNALALRQNNINRQLENSPLFQTMNDALVLDNILTYLGDAASQGLIYCDNGNLYLHPKVAQCMDDLIDRLMIGPKQIEGPEGANLFIYHLPRQCTDQNLFELFSPFGNVISTKVFIDKLTKLSKGFGFVSYDDVDSANRAIHNLNGYYILGKKLKVEVKKRKITLHYPR